MVFRKKQWDMMFVVLSHCFRIILWNMICRPENGSQTAYVLPKTIAPCDAI